MRQQILVRATLLIVLALGTSPAEAQSDVAPQSPQTSNAAAVPHDYEEFTRSLARLRQRNTEQFAIRSGTGIDEASFVTIGGIEQWITIRGQDRGNPVLLFLHGGPGDVTNPWTFALFAPWEKHFTVVQWDQRGSGRTFGRTGPSVAPTITLDRMVQDGIEVTQYLCKHLAASKIIVVAHSMGSIIGLRMVASKPDLFYAYVGTGQVGDSTRNYFVAYDALLKKAQATANQQAVEELRAVGPPPYKSGAGYRVQWKWANRFERADEFLYGTIGLRLVAPGGSIQDFVDAEQGQVVSAERLVGPEIGSLQPKDLGLKFAAPIFVVQGAEDFTTPTELARQYLDAIAAPKKAFVAIPGGHFAVFMNSDQFLQVLLQEVRPLAVSR
jgi:pimeloyl-ACP methyl ester carboxylesterase